jgi:ribosome maturation factor RimP
MELADQIKKLTEAQLKDESHFVVDALVSLKGKPGKVVVILDGDNGISIDDCAEVSRELSKALDDSNLVPDAFVLEVSTPGLDQPLKIWRQYKKNIGRNVRVKTKDNTVEGKLVAVLEDKIAVLQQTGKGKKTEPQEIEILFSDIDKTLVLVSFK